MINGIICDSPISNEKKRAKRCEKMNTSTNNKRKLKEDLSHPQSPAPSSRRPRGFAATPHTMTPTIIGKGNKKEREKEKERTKLRERHRRAITSRMLAGLRQYGKFPLPVRADMNDVLAALAREAGWTVDADGNTYRQSPPPPAQLAPYPGQSMGSPLSASSLKACSMKTSLQCHPSVLRIDENLSPSSFDSIVVAETNSKNQKFRRSSPLNAAECFEGDQLMRVIQNGKHDNDFTGTPYVPVYVKLPITTAVINSFCQLVDSEGIREELGHIKALNADGVIVDCWWGIIEDWNPQKYVWSGYRDLFSIIREFKLKMQVVMAFHEYGGNDSGDVSISLPQWVLEIGKNNQDIFFTDREGRRNTECLSWGVDKERVLRGRTGVEVYFDFMRSFRTEFDDYFTEDLISAIEIGLGASGELRYPSYSESVGWRYPGIGEFQCYDKYLEQNLRKAAEMRGNLFWAKGPHNAGHYNSRPHETGFFCERGDYDSYYGRFFLQWYAQLLIDHADNVLSLASLAFEETQIIVKIPAVYWWYRTSNHAAELTAGYYNPTNQDGYSPVFEVLKKHSVALKFACSGLKLSCHENVEAHADPEGLCWQIINSAWDRELIVAGENAALCYDREGYMRIVETAKPRNDPDHRHFSFFVYQHPSLFVPSGIGLSDLDYFFKCMHGEVSCDLP